MHRFNKSQQDGFLPHIEDGTFDFIGATTENPSFELNNALLSRLRVYVLQSLTTDDIIAVINRALQDEQRGLGDRALEVSDETMQLLAGLADGDARRALNMLEIAADFARTEGDVNLIDEDTIKQVAGDNLRRFEKGGDAFYDQISALHKSVRGSSPDASLYWLARMLDGGADPFYVARRVVRMASEDIGNADPRGLQLALNAWEATRTTGQSRRRAGPCTGCQLTLPVCQKVTPSIVPGRKSSQMFEIRVHTRFRCIFGMRRRN